MSSADSHPVCGAACYSRRLFLGSTAAAATMALGQVFPGRVLGRTPDTAVTVTRPPRVRIAGLPELQDRQPVAFSFPGDEPCQLIKTGERSGGGIGDAQDIVAFSTRCTHMGGPLDEEYQSEHNVLGPCRLHLTTFDLTRHGTVVAGHATAALPQIILELEGEDIYASGVVGLIYGHAAN